MSHIKSIIENVINYDIDDDITEIRSDFYDEAINATAIDIWLYNKQGITCAYVFDNGKINWIDIRFKDSVKVQEEIKSVLNS